MQGRRLEIEAWNDLAKIYTKLESWPDAEICLGKAKCIEFYSSRTWHQTGSNAVPFQRSYLFGPFVYFIILQETQKTCLVRMFSQNFSENDKLFRKHQEDVQKIDDNKKLSMRRTTPTFSS